LTSFVTSLIKVSDNNDVTSPAQQMTNEVTVNLTYSLTRVGWIWVRILGEV